MVGPYDLKGLFQPTRFYDSMTLWFPLPTLPPAPARAEHPPELNPHFTVGREERFPGSSWGTKRKNTLGFTHSQSHKPHCHHNCQQILFLNIQNRGQKGRHFTIFKASKALWLFPCGMELFKCQNPHTFFCIELAQTLALPLLSMTGSSTNSS